MNRLAKDQAGFGVVAILFVIMMIGVIGLLGWYVHHVQISADTALGKGVTISAKSGTSSSAATISLPNKPAGLQTNLKDLSSTYSQSINELNATLDSLDDQSTFTALP